MWASKANSLIVIATVCSCLTSDTSLVRVVSQGTTLVELLIWFV